LASKNGLYAGVTEAVVIYPLLPTTYTRHFTNADFTTVPPVTPPEPPPVCPVGIIYYWVDKLNEVKQHSLVTTEGATAGNHEVSLCVEKDGKLYSTTITVTVEAPDSGDNGDGIE